MCLFVVVIDIVVDIVVSIEGVLLIYCSSHRLPYIVERTFIVFIV